MARNTIITPNSSRNIIAISPVPLIHFMIFLFFVRLLNNCHNNNIFLANPKLHLSFQHLKFIAPLHIRQFLILSNLFQSLSTIKLGTKKNGDLQHQINRNLLVYFSHEILFAPAFILKITLHIYI